MIFLGLEVYSTSQSKNINIMKSKFRIVIVLLTVVISGGFVIQFRAANSTISPDEGCVFKTVFEGEGIEKEFYLPISEAVEAVCNAGLEWLVTAQNKSGGFGAGSHSDRNTGNQNQVATDPATTAMVAMAILRDGSNLDQGIYTKQLSLATDYLLECVENSPAGASNITTLQNTQIQSKLGGNIDVILTCQYLTNLLDEINDETVYSRVEDAVSNCVRKIEKSHEGTGAVASSGWAGVLQSSFAANSLEAAEAKGIAVDKEVLKKAKDNQKENYDVESGTIATGSAAGVMLYSVSGSSRASAKDARKASATIDQAVEDGKVESAAPVTIDNLMKAGMELNEAEESMTSYQVYNASKTRAQAADVIAGFGNNGGEEFMSFLQTGEGLIVNKDMEWQQWYNGTSQRLIDIQNKNGSWHGHHCITSPVFCTATSLLILSVNNDIDALVAQGAEQK
jgi:hypothetical protein|tara:strand:- start:1661 stop:3016 length:1356 start_codon:yes stop_codon:yes gene_type:complete